MKVYCRLSLVATLLFSFAFASSITYGVDTVSVIVNRTNATGTNSLASFAYNPNTDTMYTSTFGAGGALRKITNVGGAQVSTIAASETQIQAYYRDGDTTRTVLTPLQNGMVLNPFAIGAMPAYSFAIIADAGTTRLPGGSTTTDPLVTKRFYSYNLGSLTNGPANPTPPYNDGRDLFTTITTLKDMQNVTGATATTSNQGRTPTFAGDQQSFYFNDVSTAFGGLWKVNILTGVETRILNELDNNTEPAVVNNGGTGGIDTIYIRGGGSTTNLGGIDKVTHDLSSGTTTPREVVVSAAAINDFMELPSGSQMNSQGMIADASGNLYFSTTERKAIFKYDTQGRLSKVVSGAERADSTGIASPNSNALRMQLRDITYTGANGSFSIPQIMYAESSPGNLIAGANVFKAGDFNRDNALSSLDINLFKSENVLTTRGVAMTTVSGFTPSDYKFDMNGNEVTDWKDVKIMQQFFDFGDGDADLNGIVDFADFQILQNSFGNTGKTFLDGDFTGDNLVDFADFQILQNSFGYQSSVLLGAAPAEFNQAEWDSFVTNVVPEPSSFALIGVVCVGLGILRRRKAKTASFMSKRDANS